MTTTGKTGLIILIIILFAFGGIGYYFYAQNASNSDNTSMLIDGELGNNTLNDESTALSKDQVQGESFEQTLSAFEAELDRESAAGYYDENSYVEQSNTSGELQLEY